MSVLWGKDLLVNIILGLDIRRQHIPLCCRCVRNYWRKLSQLHWIVSAYINFTGHVLYAICTTYRRFHCIWHEIEISWHNILMNMKNRILILDDKEEGCKLTWKHFCYMCRIYIYLYKEMQSCSLVCVWFLNSTSEEDNEKAQSIYYLDRLSSQRVLFYKKKLL